MPKFIFQLDPLLRMRKRVEQDRQLAVAKLETERNAIQNAIRDRQHAIDQARHDAKAALTPGAALNLRDARTHAVAALRSQAEAQANALKLAGLLKRIDAARSELATATQARRAIERIKERRLEEHNRAEARKQAAVLDELATINAIRQREHTP